MSYSNLTAPEHQAEISQLINKLDQRIEKEIHSHQVHQDLSAAFKIASPEKRRELVQSEMQNFTTAITMLRAFGLKIEDIAKLITTA